MLNSGNKFRRLRDKKNILTLVLSEEKFLNETKNHTPAPFQVKWSVPNQIVPGGFFLFRDFNISEISIIVNSIIANFEFVLNSKFGGLQLLSSKFEMEQMKLLRKLHLSISSTYKISFSVSKRGGIVQLRPTLPISFYQETKII